jgi:hypothetical protein
MRILLLLALIALAAYLLYTSGVAARLLPEAIDFTPGPTSTIRVTIFPVVIEGSSVPIQGSPLPPPASPAAPTLDLSTPTPIPTDTPLPPPTIIIPSPPPTLGPLPTPTASSTFTITVETPRDGETLRFSPVLVVGQTQPDALVSVNDVVGFANAEGRFSLSVPLREGPNILEVLASNIAGEQVFVILTVLYQP